jgi:hypothetical protein
MGLFKQPMDQRPQAGLVVFLSENRSIFCSCDRLMFDFGWRFQNVPSGYAFTRRKDRAWGGSGIISKKREYLRHKLQYQLSR